MNRQMSQRGHRRRRCCVFDNPNGGASDAVCLTGEDRATGRAAGRAKSGLRAGFRGVPLRIGTFRAGNCHR